MTVERSFFLALALPIVVIFFPVCTRAFLPTSAPLSSFSRTAILPTTLFPSTSTSTSLHYTNDNHNGDTIELSSVFATIPPTIKTEALTKTLPETLTATKTTTTRTTIKKRNTIKFNSKHQLAWEEKFHELQSYVNDHGHANVPFHYPTNPSLGVWVVRQRQARKQQHQQQEQQQGKQQQETQAHAPGNTNGSFVMTLFRRQALDSLNFTWNTRLTWDHRYEELVAYKKSHGHCHVVPLDTHNDHNNHKKGDSNHPPDASTPPPPTGLGRWLLNQKQHCRKLRQGQPTSMTLDKFNALVSLGAFDEDMQQVVWNKRYKELVAFHSCYGHCHVPRASSSSSSSSASFGRLGKWVDTQKMAYAAHVQQHGTARKKYQHPHQHQKRSVESTTTNDHRDRIERLDKLGFFHPSPPSLSLPLPTTSMSTTTTTTTPTPQTNKIRHSKRATGRGGKDATPPEDQQQQSHQQSQQQSRPRSKENRTSNKPRSYDMHAYEDHPSSFAMEHNDVSRMSSDEKLAAWRERFTPLRTKKKPGPKIGGKQQQQQQQ